MRRAADPISSSACRSPAPHHRRFIPAHRFPDRDHHPSQGSGHHRILPLPLLCQGARWWRLQHAGPQMQIILLSASAAKLAKLKKHAAPHASLTMPQNVQFFLPCIALTSCFCDITSYTGSVLF